jgi:RES domain-containing protein
LLTAWRIVKKRYAASAFDGEGARLFGGRWNSPGVPVVYLASTRSLAALEMAVHLDRSMLLTTFVLIPCEFDKRLVTVMNRAALPPDWRRDPPPPEAAAIGDAWVRGAQSAVLALPSAIIEEETIFLVNSAHLDFSAIRIGDPQDFEFDRRLIRLRTLRVLRRDRLRGSELAVEGNSAKPSEVRDSNIQELAGRQGFEPR